MVQSRLYWIMNLGGMLMLQITLLSAIEIVGSGSHNRNVRSLKTLLNVDASSLVGRALCRVALEKDFDKKFSRCKRQNYTVVKTLGFRSHGRKQVSNHIIRLGYSTNYKDSALADGFDLFYEILFGDAIDHFYYKPIVMLHAMAQVCERESTSHVLYTDLDVINIRIGQGARKSSRITVHTEFFNSSANAGFILVPCKLHFVKQIIYWSLLGQSELDLESDQTVLRCVISVNQKMFNMMPANSLSHHAYSTTPNRSYVLRFGPHWNSIRECFRAFLCVAFLWRLLSPKLGMFSSSSTRPPLMFPYSTGTQEPHFWLFVLGIWIGILTIQDLGFLVEKLGLGYIDNGRCNEYAKMYQIGTSKYIRLTTRKNKTKISTLEYCLMIKTGINPNVLVLSLDLIALISEFRVIFSLVVFIEIFRCVVRRCVSIATRSGYMSQNSTGGITQSPERNLFNKPYRKDSILFTFIYLGGRKIHTAFNYIQEYIGSSLGLLNQSSTSAVVEGMRDSRKSTQTIR